MAANQLVADRNSELMDELSCDICMNEFHSINRIPKNLPCGHCCCEQCAHQLSANSSMIICPTCRNEFSVTDNTFTTNFKLRNILQLIETNAIVDANVNIGNDQFRNEIETICNKGIWGWIIAKRYARISQNRQICFVLNKIAWYKVRVYVENCLASNTSRCILFNKSEHRTLQGAFAFIDSFDMFEKEIEEICKQSSLSGVFVSTKYNKTISNEKICFIITNQSALYKIRVFVDSDQYGCMLVAESEHPTLEAANDFVNTIENNYLIDSSEFYENDDRFTFVSII